ncbi:hypothetical protein PV327_011728, partial [Microctonus hyperodae]
DIRVVIKQRRAAVDTAVIQEIILAIVVIIIRIIIIHVMVLDRGQVVMGKILLVINRIINNKIINNIHRIRDQIGVITIMPIHNRHIFKIKTEISSRIVMVVEEVAVLEEEVDKKSKMKKIIFQSMKSVITLCDS